MLEDAALLSGPHGSWADGVDAQTQSRARSLMTYVHCYLLSHSKMCPHSAFCVSFLLLGEVTGHKYTI